MKNKQKKLSPEPQQTGDQGWWYYEENGGILVYVAEYRDPFLIPWRKLRASLKRKDAAKAIP